MKRFCTTLLAGFFVLGLQAAQAEAATRYIGTSGTASGSGICSITIESFEPNRPSTIEPLAVINVSIPSGAIPDTTAARIRSDLDAALSGDYDVTLPSGYPGVVRIHHKVGPFSMSISENVPGQVIQEVGLNVPAAGLVGRLLLGLLLAAGALFVLLRRRNPRTSEALS